MEERLYVIFNVSELDKINFLEVMEDSAQTVRTSYDGSKTFVKYSSETTPSFLKDLETKEGPYSHSEILEILSAQEWTKPEPIKS